MIDLSAALLYNLIVVLAIWGGAWLGLSRRGISARSIARFSAGVFLGVAFFEMIPESVVRLGESTGYYILAGYLLIYLLEHFAMVHPCEERACDFHKVGIAAFAGLSIHSLLNGLALGSSLIVPRLAFPVFLATLLHKVPESLSLTNLLVLGNRPRRTVIAYVAAFSGMVPLGTFLAVWGLRSVSPECGAGAIAFSVGMFLQIATGDLLIHGHKEERKPWADLALMLFGIMVVGAGRWIGGR